MLKAPNLTIAIQGLTPYSPTLHPVICNPLLQQGNPSSREGLTPLHSTLSSVTHCCSGGTPPTAGGRLGGGRQVAPSLFLTPPPNPPPNGEGLLAGSFFYATPALRKTSSRAAPFFGVGTCLTQRRFYHPQRFIHLGLGDNQRRHQANDIGHSR